MDKDVVVPIHNGILLSYKKEHIRVSSNEVDKTGASYTEWSKSERETPMQYINAPPHSKSWLIGKDPDPGRD